MGYFRIALKGFTWITFLRSSMRIIAFIRIAVLARIFLPSQFGSFGIAALTISFLELLMETGINVFLIQQEDKLETHLNTAWVISIIRGGAISLVILLVSLPVSTFFGSQESVNLLYLISLVPLIRGFINPASIKFQKYLEFNKEFLYRISIIFFEASFTIILALITKSISSLVWGMIISTCFEVYISFLVVRPHPRFSLNILQAKQILQSGKWITLYGISDYIFTQGDNLVVGKMLGVSALGIYQTAYKISTTPITETMDIFYRVTFPMFSRMFQAKSPLKSGVFRSAFTLVGLVIILGLGVFIFARPLVMILLGPNWLQAVPVVKVLAFLGIARASAHAFSPLFMALKKQKLITIITLFSTLGLIITIVPFVTYYGIVGAGYSATLSSFIAIPISVWFAYTVIKKIS